MSFAFNNNYAGNRANSSNTNRKVGNYGKNSNITNYNNNNTNNINNIKSMKINNINSINNGTNFSKMNMMHPLSSPENKMIKNVNAVNDSQIDNKTKGYNNIRPYSNINNIRNLYSKVNNNISKSTSKASLNQSKNLNSKNEINKQYNIQNINSIKASNFFAKQVNSKTTYRPLTPVIQRNDIINMNVNNKGQKNVKDNFSIEDQRDPRNFLNTNLQNYSKINFPNDGGNVNAINKSKNDLNSSKSIPNKNRMMNNTYRPNDSNRNMLSKGKNGVNPNTLRSTSTNFKYSGNSPTSSKFGGSYKLSNNRELSSARSTFSNNSKKNINYKVNSLNMNRNFSSSLKGSKGNYSNNFKFKSGLSKNNLSINQSNSKEKEKNSSERNSGGKNVNVNVNNQAYGHNNLKDSTNEVKNSNNLGNKFYQYNNIFNNNKLINSQGIQVIGGQPKFKQIPNTSYNHKNTKNQNPKLEYEFSDNQYDPNIIDRLSQNLNNMKKSNDNNNNNMNVNNSQNTVRSNKFLQQDSSDKENLGKITGNFGGNQIKNQHDILRENDTSPFPHYHWKKIDDKKDNKESGFINLDGKEEFSSSKYRHEEKLHNEKNNQENNIHVIRNDNSNSNISSTVYSKKTTTNSNPNLTNSQGVNNSTKKLNTNNSNENENSKITSIGQSSVSGVVDSFFNSDEIQNLISGKSMNKSVNKSSESLNITNNKSGKLQAMKKIRCMKEVTKTGFNGEETKKNNQDIAIVHKNFAGEKDTFFLSVCDGHGALGHDVSKYIKENLPHNLEKELGNKKLNVFTSDRESVNKVIEDTFNFTNNSLNKSSVETDFSGSTCVSIFTDLNKIISANIGDSRVVLGKVNNKGGKYN